MDYSQARGNITELQCISKFMEFGIECSVPYGNGAKYDFIADLNGELIRVQCKSSKAIDDDSFMFDCTCSTTNTKKTTRYTYSKTIIDYFATFFNGKVYIVPVEECSTSKTLRTAPPKSKGVNWNNAEDYLLDTFLEQYSLNLILTEQEVSERTRQERKERQSLCKMCGTEIGERAVTGLCPACYAKSNRKVKRPEREVLKQMIRTLPFLEIGRQYGVSDNAVRKWCDAEGLPRKKTEINKYTDEEWAAI